MDVTEAVDVLVHFLGNRSSVTFVDDLGWSLDRVQRWLAHAVRTAVLRDGGATPDP